jgi:hypothetical protein
MAIYLSLTDDIFDTIPRFFLALSPVHNEKRSLLPEFRGLLSGERCELDGAMTTARSFAGASDDARLIVTQQGDAKTARS